MLIDYFLMVNILVFAVDKQLKGYLDQNTVLVVIFGCFFGLIGLRIIGSQAFRSTTRIPKVLFGLILFAANVTYYDPALMVFVIVITLGTAVCMFGFYFMFSWMFPKQSS
jgi:hypothetical protein